MFWLQRRRVQEALQILQEHGGPLSLDQLVSEVVSRHHQAGGVILLSSASLRRKLRLRRAIERRLAGSDATKTWRAGVCLYSCDASRGRLAPSASSSLGGLVRGLLRRSRGNLRSWTLAETARVHPEERSDEGSRTSHLR
jgi:hypothetical protein